MTVEEFADMARMFARTSVSAERNRLYAMKADKAGNAGLAGLLDAVAASESIQARRILMHLRGKIGEIDEDRLSTLAEAKRAAFSRDFPEVARTLEDGGRKTAAEAFEQFARVAETHHRLLTGLADYASGPVYYVCGVCGHLAVEEPPEKCPVCGAVRKRFERRGERGGRRRGRRLRRSRWPRR